ncbi:hypothetical protein [Hymenobacter koreensis]|uniref:Uncharacterized protein n=1 Tax=Hymenobacter koreensis TaxID=1084523 RepID=A0ABP8IUK7_9BACT
MASPRLFSFYCAAFLAAGSFAAQAQSKAISAQQLPLTAAKLADFVPKGWRIEQRLGADINADQQPDSVLALIQTAQYTGKNGVPTRDRALVVALAQPEGMWRRAGFTAQLLYCTSCFLSSGSAPALTLSEQGVLEVAHGDFDGDVGSSSTVQFKFEPQTGRLRLINEEVTRHYSRSKEKSISTDLLTGNETTTTEESKDEDEEPRVKTQTRTLKLPKYYLEDYKEGRTLLHKF